MVKEVYECDKGCCHVVVYPSNPYNRYKRRDRCKAGVFIYDPFDKRVLIVQSRGNLWGCPKGTLNFGESVKDGAIREVKEETGLEVCSRNFTKSTTIHSSSVYFYTEMKMCDVVLSKDVSEQEQNDVNGIGWVKVDCLLELVKRGNITLNHHCKILLSRFLGQQFPQPDFIPVKRKKKLLLPPTPPSQPPQSTTHSIHTAGQ